MFSKETYTQRRALLKKTLGSGVLLFLGNDECGLNYEDNTFRYRQDSTFLYYFAYRCFYRNDYSADSYHDCGSHLSERADYEQESTGYFRGSYGSAYPYYEQSGSE